MIIKIINRKIKIVIKPHYVVSLKQKEKIPLFRLAKPKSDHLKEGDQLDEELRELSGCNI